MASIADLQGVWLSLGYNRLLYCTSVNYTFYDLSKISCVERKFRPDAPLTGSMAEFFELFDRFEFINPDLFGMYQVGGITRYAWERLSELPERLIRETASKALEPEYNFDVFWHYFAENYAFFDLREVDWDEIYRTFRPRVSAHTTDDQLLAIFTEILYRLGDNHVSLRAGDRLLESSVRNALYRQWEKETGQTALAEIKKSGFEKLTRFVMDEILGGHGKKAANDLIVWGRAAPRTGYLLVRAMTGFTDTWLIHENLSVLKEAMAQVVEDFADLDAVIIDARFNPGGYDSAALAIAGCFTDQKRPVFTKKAVTADGYTEEQQIFIEPQGAYPFTKPVVFLTSAATISAAEIFTLCMMALPHVTRIGEPTQGVLSDILVKILPNGWVLGLSNEVYTACDGLLYEGIGIPPHIHQRIYDEKNFYPVLKAVVNQAAAWVEEKKQAAP